MSRQKTKFDWGSLQIKESMQHEKRSWVVQRVSWGVMAFLVLCGFFGVFGKGPLSHATTSQSQNLWVEYERFAQLDNLTEIRVHVQNPHGGSELLQLIVDKVFFDKMDVKGIMPEPEKVEVASDHLIYTFHADAISAPVTVRFDVEPRRVGKLKGWFASSTGEPTSFQQFVYP